MKSKKIISGIVAVFLLATIVLVSQNLNTTLSEESSVIENQTDQKEKTKEVPKLTKTPS